MLCFGLPILTNSSLCYFPVPYSKMSGTKSPPRVNRQNCLKTPSTVRQSINDLNNSKIYFIVGLFISHSHTYHCLLFFSLSILVTSSKQFCRDNDDYCCKHGMLENSDDSRLEVWSKRRLLRVLPNLLLSPNLDMLPVTPQ